MDTVLHCDYNFNILFCDLYLMAVNYLCSDTCYIKFFMCYYNKQNIFMIENFDVGDFVYSHKLCQLEASITVNTHI